jgi:xanthine dehydrogenase accessory factor
VDDELRSVAADVLERGRSRTVEAGGRSWFLEAFPRQPRLVIVGAVQVAMPLDAIARTLGYRTVVIDGRATFATRERFPDADELLVGWPDELADTIGLGPRDAVVVLTHDVKFDEPAIVTALQRGCRYVGAVGSRKTQAARRARLLEAGVRAEDLDRLRGPIGLDLGGREPAETALAIMAEVIATRFGGTGEPLKQRAATG